MKIAGKEKDNRNKPEHKRVWASLTKGKEKTISEVGQEMERREKDKKKTRVVITDGERALQRQVKNQIKDITEDIRSLSCFIEAMEGCLCISSRGKLRGKGMGQETDSDILQGKVSQAIKGIRQKLQREEPVVIIFKTVDDVTRYFYRNRPHMKYNEYLSQGLPIASGWSRRGMQESCQG